MGITFLIIIAVIALSVFLIYNNIINQHNGVQRAWADVLTQERQRGHIIPELERILKEHTAYEGEVQTKITALRRGLDVLSKDEINPKQQHEVSLASQELLKTLQVSIENYPELRASASFSQYMNEIINQEDNVGAALRIFNQNVAVFNSLIESFPGNIINCNLTKKPVIHTFQDETASKSFDYKPNFD